MKMHANVFKYKDVTTTNFEPQRISAILWVTSGGLLDHFAGGQVVCRFKLLSGKEFAQKGT